VRVTCRSSARHPHRRGDRPAYHRPAPQAPAHVWIAIDHTPLAPLAAGDIVLTALGRPFANASILARKESVATHALRLPAIRCIYGPPQRHDDGRVADGYFFDILAHAFGDYVR